MDVGISVDNVAGEVFFLTCHIKSISRCLN